MKSGKNIFLFDEVNKTGSVVAFNPVAELWNDIDYLMCFMQEIYGDKLTEEQYKLAKETALNSVNKNDVPTLYGLVKAWRKEAILIDFANRIADVALPK